VQRFSPSALREARLKAGVPQERIALDIDRGVDVVRKYEGGQVVPPANVLAALADVLGVDPGDLFADDEEVSS